MSNLPYNPIQEANGVYYLSGVIGIDTATKVANPDFKAQAYQTFDNLVAVLETQNLKLTDIVKTTVFLTDMDDYAALNEVYLEKFPTPPARTCVAVAELPRVANIPLKIEIEAIAVAADRRP